MEGQERQQFICCTSVPACCSIAVAIPWFRSALESGLTKSFRRVSKNDYDIRITFRSRVTLLSRLGSGGMLNEVECRVQLLRHAADWKILISAVLFELEYGHIEHIYLSDIMQ